MKPLRHPLVPARGHRTPQTMLLIDERNALLIEAARRFCVGMSDNQAAALLHARLNRYRAGPWRRDASELLCPARHRGTISEFCWMTLKVADRLPSERLIRLILSKA